MTIREILAAGKARLAAAGVDTAALDASLLLAEVLGVSRSALVAASGGSDALGETERAAFEGLLARRERGECVAYILRRKEFYGLEFFVNESVLVPRPDTETLVEAAIARLSAAAQALRGNQPLRMLDLCAGSGAVAIAVKSEMPHAETWATDISAAALEVACANAARLLPPDSIRFRQGDLFDALSLPGDERMFHLIVSNPPYVPTGDISSLSPEARGEPGIALDGGEDGLDIIRRVVSRAREFLHPGGALMLEADPRQMREIASLLGRAGFAGIETRRDLAGRERVIAGEAGA